MRHVLTYWRTLKGQVLEFGGTRGGKCRYWKLAVTVLWWKLQVLETGGIDTGGKCRYRKLQVQLTCVENAGTGKQRYSFNNNETLNYINSTVRC